MTKEKLIEILDKLLYGNENGNGDNGAITDIAKAMKEGVLKNNDKVYAPNLAIFILGSCFIDAMAGFYHGVDQNMIRKGGSGLRFKSFVKKYLPQYDPKSLYLGLRCGLVHNYTNQLDKYLFMSGRNDQHMNLLEDKIIINRENFIEDIKKAYKEFRNDIINDDSIFENAKKRLISLKLLGTQEMELPPDRQ